MDNSRIKYRHEYKYPLSDLEAAIIKERLKTIMPLDSHVGPTGKYLISSLYFDDYYDSCLSENENGIDPKEKFRIRIYNHDSSRISLECKRKERGKTLKTSCSLTKEQVDLIVSGKRLVANDSMNPLLKKFIYQQNSRNLKPKVIVDYQRVPFIYKQGNVRITFDSDLSSSSQITGFLTGDYPTRPIMPVGSLLLEVKFDEFLPDYIYEVMQLENLTQTAFSKYYLCRRQNL